MYINATQVIGFLIGFTIFSLITAISFYKIYK